MSSPGGALALARSAVDRAAHRRSDDGWLASAWPAALVLVVDDGAALVDDAGSQRPRLVLLDAESAPGGERILLGVDAAQTAYFAVIAPLPVGRGTPLGLRDVGAVLDDRDAGLLVHAVAVANWHATHRYCPRCGGPTASAAAGHVRRCELDGSDHFPRVDPAVIMLVYDDDDRIVLGRAPVWQDNMHSVLAGFVEPGESLEQAVAREVAEEVGLAVTDVRYAANQPWPFPSSLMLGFTARAEGAPLRVDHEELVSAGWFSRSQLGAAVAEHTLTLPPPVSIARRLVDAWLAGGLP